MQIAPVVSFSGMDTSKALKAHILEKIAVLEKFHPRIISCKVIVNSPHRLHHKGRLYSVRITLAVPGKQIAVGLDPGNNHAHEDVLVAIRDAFDDARRRFEDLLRMQSSHRTKQPRIAMQGEVVRLFPNNGYGFIAAADGREIFFNFDRLSDKARQNIELGTKVRFTVTDEWDGPYAHSVAPLSMDS